MPAIPATIFPTMKIRIQGNSVRLRLSQQEVARLSSLGIVEESIRFGTNPDDTLLYALSKSTTKHMDASFHQHRISILVPTPWADDWAASDQVGMEGSVPVGPNETLRILVEKDFQCPKPRPGEDDSDLFPHPDKSVC
ncbi:MAG: hypothetical protein RLY31_1331 [Bacteroidota bacterium]|jgi:hypothetical protein